MYGRYERIATSSYCQFLLPLLSICAALLSPTTAAKSNLKDYDDTPIASEAHHQYTTDASRIVWPWRSYRTSKHTPPELKITRYGGRLAKGYLFLSPSDSHGHDGTYDLSGTGIVMDQNGDLIFAADEDDMAFCDEWVAGMTDFRVQKYSGKNYITYWNGCNTRGRHWGHRWGRVTFIDEEYQKFSLNPDLNINTLEPATRGNIDVHEHQMTDRDSIVVTSYNNTQLDLTYRGGPPDAWVADGMFFDIDFRTQEVLFKWRALHHLDLNATHYGIEGAGAGASERVPWDWLHINSVQRVGEDYLISARHHFAIYLISGQDGSVLWKLDGTDGGTFGSIPENFRWQHHARAHNVSKDGMTVSLFNNMFNGPKNEQMQTSGLVFWLPLPPDKNNPPVLIRKLQTPDNMVFSGTQGSYQMDLGNGNGLIGYGIVPITREYDSAGRLLWQGQFGEKTAVQNYRTFKMEWHGTPKDWDPVALIEDTRHHIPRVYVSWNGATDLSGWAVFAGSSKAALQSVGVAPKKAFETVFEVDRNVECVQIGAIRSGRIIRKSNVACLSDTPAVSIENELLPDDNVATHGSSSDPAYARLQAENARLQTELDRLQQLKWFSYERFTEVAIGIVILLLAASAIIIIRHRRRQKQYKPIQNEEW